jgi:signal transduction histidine kinase
VELVTRWIINQKIDEFFWARLRLAFYYSISAIIILGAASIMLYETILSNLSDSILENVFDPILAESIINKAKDILRNRFLTIDSIITVFIILFGFFVTNKTLKPIRNNIQKQKRFIADASHELRTPTAVVISRIEVALENKKLNFNLAKKTLENTLEEMREFSKLSNTLLDLSKYDMPRQKEYELININKLIKYFIEKNKNLSTKKNIHITASLGSEVFVRGNKIELQRIFSNILDNAIKHTKSGVQYIYQTKLVFINISCI